MPVAFRSMSIRAADDTQGGGIAIPVPPSLQVNDIVVLNVGQFDHFGAAIGKPAACTQFAQAEQGNTRVTGFWKRVTSVGDATDEPDGFYNFTWTDGSTWGNGSSIACSGGITTGDPIGTNFVTGAAVSASFPTLTLPSVGFQPFLAWMAYHASSSATSDVPDNFTSVTAQNYGMSAYRVPGSTGVFQSVGATVSASMNLAQILAAIQPAGASATSDALKRDKQMRLSALMQM
jgi:hypothetical protein